MCISPQNMANSNSDSISDSDSDGSKSKDYESHLQNSSFTVMDMLSHGQVSQAIYIVAKFRIADYLKNGPKSVEELAVQSKTHPDSLYRLLRMLASVGIFTETRKTGRRKSTIIIINENSI